MSFIYRPDGAAFKVGHYAPKPPGAPGGILTYEFITESIHGTHEDAAARCHWLNGGDATGLKHTDPRKGSTYVKKGAKP